MKFKALVGIALAAVSALIFLAPVAEAQMGGGMASTPQQADPGPPYRAGVAALNAEDYPEAIRNLRAAQRAAPRVREGPAQSVAGARVEEAIRCQRDVGGAGGVGDYVVTVTTDIHGWQYAHDGNGIAPSTGESNNSAVSASVSATRVKTRSLSLRVIAPSVRPGTGARKSCLRRKGSTSICV